MGRKLIALSAISFVVLNSFGCANDGQNTAAEKADASGSNRCEIKTDSGGRLGQALNIGVSCDFQITDLYIDGVGSKAVPWHEAWSSAGSGGKCITTEKSPLSDVRCAGLGDLNSDRRRWVWTAIQTDGDLCSKKLNVQPYGGVRCPPDTSCVLIGLSSILKVRRINGCV